MASAPRPRTADDMRAFLAHLLAGAAGGTEARWQKLIGTVEKMPIWQFVAYNWRVSERRACMVVGTDRTSMRYRLCRADDGDSRSRLRELAQQRRRFGYRRLHILLRRDGISINRKKTQRGSVRAKWQAGQGADLDRG